MQKLLLNDEYFNEYEYKVAIKNKKFFYHNFIFEFNQR